MYEEIMKTIDKLVEKYGDAILDVIPDYVKQLSTTE